MRRAASAARRLRRRAFLAAALLALAALGAGGLSACGDAARSGYAGYWQAADEASLGGSLLLHIEKAGDGAFAIAGLRFLGPAADKAHMEKGVLVAWGEGTGAEGFRAEFALREDDSSLKMALFRPGATEPILEIDFLAAEGSEEDLAERLAEQEERANVLRVEQGFDALRAGLRRWAREHGGSYPTKGKVQPFGPLKEYVQPWPENPYSGAPMLPGRGPGRYTYERLNGGGAMRLAAHVAQGADFVTEE